MIGVNIGKGIYLLPWNVKLGDKCPKCGGKIAALSFSRDESFLYCKRQPLHYILKEAENGHVPKKRTI